MHKEGAAEQLSPRAHGTSPGTFLLLSAVTFLLFSYFKNYTDTNLSVFLIYYQLKFLSIFVNSKKFVMLQLNCLRIVKEEDILL